MATADPAVVRELEALERSLASFVASELSQVAYEFTRAVRGSTELTAAVFLVSSIRGMWRARVPAVMRRVLGVAQQSVNRLARQVGIRQLPPGWSDLSSPSQLPDELQSWADEVNRRLLQVGDTMAEEAMAELAEGLNAGETQAQLEARLIAAFNRNSHLMGPDRSNRIAATEAVSAWNAAALGFARAASATGIGLEKQWVTRRDDKVRTAHRGVAGQTRPLQDAFDVDGVRMQYPGDPTAPSALVINCRCVLQVERVAVAASVAVDEGVSMNDFEAEVEALQSRMPAQLKRYWLAGPGAARIGWGTPGSFRRCVRELRDEFPEDTEGLCANLYHEATGRWPGQNRAAAVNPDGTVHTGAMVALVPSDEDAARLALDGGEAAGQLHLTLAYLGEAADWTEESRAILTGRMADGARHYSPLNLKVFGLAQWNPTSDEPAWVWNVGDDPETSGPPLADFRADMMYALEEFELPPQHTPWAAHVCATYGADADLTALAERVGPITFDRLVVAFGGEWALFDLEGPASAESMADDVDEDDLMEAEDTPHGLVTWGSDGTSVLAFENVQTGDGRAFEPSALYWDDRPKPLMYTDEIGEGHEGARLAGAIFGMERNGYQVTGNGVLYPTIAAGCEAQHLLREGAPLGVSVDLDDVSLVMVDQRRDDGAEYTGHLVTASVLMSPEGGYTLTGETASEWTASGLSLAGESSRVVFHVGPDGMVPAAAFTAAANDPATGGTVLEQSQTGEYLMRITRARVRGATLVPIPAFSDARIVLDGTVEDFTLAAASSDDDSAGYDRVVSRVNASGLPVTASDIAHELTMRVGAVKRHLAAAAQKGYIVRIARGTYIRNDQEPDRNPFRTVLDARTARNSAVTASAFDGDVLTAAATGAVDLPVADRDHEWDGPGAESRVLDWADGDGGRIGQAFAYCEDGADRAVKSTCKLGFADIIDGRLTIVPRGVFAAQAALSGARGGVDIPADQRSAVENKLERLRVHVEEATGGDDRDRMEASAWSAIKDLPPMPADWFREPTPEELPTDMGGVHYSGGRIFGWVARAGEPHAGFAKKITIESLGRIDTTHFLRQRFTLDDGSTVRAGALTMNTGHHRDGAECETAACAFDDTRTVAGIVTVGMNARGMWFSGAAHPTLSEWDRRVFMACEPSYHLKKGGNGAWQLRGVLTVPVPGHSTPMVASISGVVERNNLALTAAAQEAEIQDAITAAEEMVAETPQTDRGPAIDYDKLADALVAAMARADQKKQEEADELEALLAEDLSMFASGYDVATTDDDAQEGA